MSETNEKLNPGGAFRRQERTRQELQEKKKVRTIAITVVAVLALLFAGALFVNSKYIRRTMTAITVGGVGFTAAEYDYFFNNAYYDYYQLAYQTLGDYASSMLPSTDKPMKSQIFNQETGETWADYLSSEAIKAMSEAVLLNDAAAASGFTMSDEAREEMEAEIDSMRSTALMYGYSSLDKYLRGTSMYGSSMNERTLLEIIEFVYTARAYSNHVYDSFSYSADELSEYYNENKDSFDRITYRSFLFNAETVNESDFDSTEEYEAAQAQAMEDAGTKAAEIAAGIKSEEDFIAAARDYDENTFAADDSTLKTINGGALADSFKEWIIDSSRKEGDVSTAEVTGGYHILYFVSRSDNSYNMPEMRQILFSKNDINESDYDDTEAFLQAYQQEESRISTLAKYAFKLFEDEGATEEKLLELMPEYSDDTTEGGHYTEIEPGQMVSEIDSWLFDPARKIGDYELILTEDYGYHLVYLSGFGERYCDFLAGNKLRENDYTSWKESLGTAASQTHWAFVLTMQ